jgi:glutamyl endopeptidase
MATIKGKPAAKLNDHSPVSNESLAAAEVVKKSVVVHPSEGPNAKASKLADGYEAVSGFKMASAEAAAEGKAPDTTGLRDIGEASFGAPDGGMSARSVIGNDDRVRISPASSYPWSATASLLIQAADNSNWIGTGWFISPRTLITAGHCVFIKGSGVPGRDGWVKRIWVMPGRDGSSTPFGSVSTTSFRSVTGWTNSGNQEFDYGAIIIPTTLGSQTGTLGYGNFSDATLRAATGNIAGYPGDKPTGTMWYHARRIVNVGARKVFYDIDTAGGQSGAAVYIIQNGKRYACAVHAYGGSVNSGTRINSQVFANLNGWKV